MSDNTKRLISKNFYCNKCKESFKKLQNITIDNAICPKCNYNNCKENKNVNLFSKKLLKIKPFSISPFSKSIQRTNFDFNQILNGQNIIIEINDFFIDNYSSNFISNFYNPMTRIVYSQLMKNSFLNEKSSPLNSKQIKLIKKFNLKDFYCKKLNDGNFENPNCLFCLQDILLNQKTFLLRCGHLFHKNCFIQNISKHSICPFCKFDILNNHSKINIDIKNDKENINDTNNKLKLSKSKDNLINEVKKSHLNINILGINRDFLELLN
jgi:hypothetical protein